MTYWSVGVGAIGSVVAGKIAEQIELVLVDAWREHVETINARGLTVEYPDGTIIVRPRAYRLEDVASIGVAPDVVLLSVKSDQTEATVTRIAPYLSAGSAIVSVQNSLNEETIASIVGAERTIGAMVRMDGNLKGPGHAVSMSRQRQLVIGELDGSVTDRVRAIAGTLSTGIPTDVTTNIWGLLWTKMVRNAEVNAVAALTGLDTARIVADPRLRSVALGLGTESVRVALKLGMQLDAFELYGPPESYLRPLDSPEMQVVAEGFMRAFAAGFRPSMLQDVEKGRPTEIDYLNGYVARKGASVGVPTPLNAAITRLVKEIDAGTRHPDPEAIDEVFATLKLPA